MEVGDPTTAACCGFSPSGEYFWYAAGAVVHVRDARGASPTLHLRSVTCSDAVAAVRWAADAAMFLCEVHARDTVHVIAVDAMEEVLRVDEGAARLLYADWVSPSVFYTMNTAGTRMTLWHAARGNACETCHISTPKHTALAVGGAVVAGEAGCFAVLGRENCRDVLHIVANLGAVEHAANGEGGGDVAKQSGRRRGALERKPHRLAAGVRSITLPTSDARSVIHLASGGNPTADTLAAADAADAFIVVDAHPTQPRFVVVAADGSLVHNQQHGGAHPSGAALRAASPAPAPRTGRGGAVEEEENTTEAHASAARTRAVPLYTTATSTPPTGGAGKDAMWVPASPTRGGGGGSPIGTRRASPERGAFTATAGTATSAPPSTSPPPAPTGAAGGITAHCLAPRGCFLYVGTAFGAVEVYDTLSWSLVATMRVPRAVPTAYFDPTADPRTVGAPYAGPVRAAVVGASEVLPKELEGGSGCAVGPPTGIDGMRGRVELLVCGGDVGDAPSFTAFTVASHPRTVWLVDNTTLTLVQAVQQQGPVRDLKWRPPAGGHSDPTDDVPTLAIACHTPFLFFWQPTRCSYAPLPRPSPALLRAGACAPSAVHWRPAGLAPARALLLAHDVGSSTMCLALP